MVPAAERVEVLALGTVRTERTYRFRAQRPVTAPQLHLLYRQSRIARGDVMVGGAEGGGVLRTAAPQGGAGARCEVRGCSDQ